MRALIFRTLSSPNLHRLQKTTAMIKRFFLLVLALVVVCGGSTLPARAVDSVPPATLSELDKAVGSNGKGVRLSRNDTKNVVG